MGKKPPVHECALCQKQAKLRHSHIIPEFQYRPLYDPLHRYNVISTKAGTRPRLAQKGAREYLLCHDCEQRFSKWEMHAKEVIFGAKLKLKDNTSIGQRLEGLDYKSYRLYLLSVIWRMGIAKQQMFENVVLGEHEAKLREMLIGENPGEPHQYACFLTVVTLNGTFRADWILQPDIYDDSGIEYCRCVINGVLYVFRLSTEPWDIPEEFAVAKAGTLFLAIKDASEVPFINDALRQQHDNMRK